MLRPWPIAWRHLTLFPPWTGAGAKICRELHTFTIDSALSRDFDDALSVRTLENGLHEVGVHIADVAEFITRGDDLDNEAEVRVSSIYLPDGRISMLPPLLSEGLFSLHAGEDRFSLSFIMHLDDEGVIHHQEIFPSVVRVHRQMTYREVNERHQEDETTENSPCPGRCNCAPRGWLAGPSSFPSRKSRST